jgi:uncharacterized protein YkwD
VQLATKAGLYLAAIVLSLAAAIVGIVLWGSDGSLQSAGSLSAALALLPIQVAQEQHDSLIRELAAEQADPPDSPPPTDSPPVLFTPEVTPETAATTDTAPDAENVSTEPDPAAPASPGLLGIGVPTQPPTPEPPPAPGNQNYALADQLLALINGARDAAGVSQLTRHSALTASAEAYSRFHFLTTDPFMLSHYLDGSPGDRAQRAGFSGLVGEVLVTGSPSAQQLFDAWMNSPAHHDILFDPAYTWIGMGCYEGPTVSNGVTFEAALCTGDLGG